MKTQINYFKQKNIQAIKKADLYHSAHNYSSLSPLIDIQTRFCMDISLTQKRNGTQIEPQSVHGMLWLQTHFEADHWESLSNSLVTIPAQDAKMLFEDAEQGGINVSFINSLSQLDKI